MDDRAHADGGFVLRREYRYQAALLRHGRTVEVGHETIRPDAWERIKLQITPCGRVAAESGIALPPREPPDFPFSARGGNLMTPVTDYDRVAYPAFAHPQTFIGNLAAKGWLRGLDVAPPDQSRVLELGCGDGFNLAAMAQLYPNAHYTGLDYAADAIERGRRMIGDLGLTRVRLEAADIRQPPPDLGEFDYIIAHGVYSWVPEDVCDSLLAIMSRHLAPNGVGFVSYLAQPGAQMREMVRLMLHFHTRGQNDPIQRVKQARALLDILSDANTDPNLYAQWLKAETAVIAGHSDAAFFHDELATFSRPMLFTDFLGHAARHGLEFLSEAEYLVPVSQGLSDKAKAALKPLERDRVLLEQYLDFVEGRRFRQTLLCRPGKCGDLRLDRLESFHLSFLGAPTKPEPVVVGDASEVEFRGDREAYVRARTPMEKAFLLELLSRIDSASYSELRDATFARLRAAAVEIGEHAAESLARFALRAAVPGIIRTFWGASPIAPALPRCPRASALARWQVAQGFKAIVALTGAFIALDGDLGRHLVLKLDGTRDLEALLTDVRSFLAAAHEKASTEGITFSGPLPDDPTLRTQLQQSLTSLRQLGLIYREE